MLTLSKKQRPTSSGQSVYASSSFRKVLVKTVRQTLKVKNAPVNKLTHKHVNALLLRYLL